MMAAMAPSKVEFTDGGPFAVFVEFEWLPNGNLLVHADDGVEASASREFSPEEVARLRCFLARADGVTDV